MKLNEKFVDLGNGKFGVQSTFSNDPYLNRTRILREHGAGKLPESWCVGSIPMHLLAQWMKEENISWEDREGRTKLIMRKLNDPDFKKLRIAEGRV